MSPSTSARSSGMPWQMTSLTEVHTDFGKPRYRSGTRVHAPGEVRLVRDAVELVGGDADPDRGTGLGEHVARDAARRDASARSRRVP